MASLRLLVSATTPDAISTANIRTIPNDGILRVVNLWASSVTVTDTIALFLNNTEIMAAGTMNVSAAALGMVDTDRDQLVFNTLVGGGDLRVPVPALTTSLIFLLSVEPRL